MAGRQNLRSDARSRARARRVGFLGVLGAAILPVALWWKVIRDVWLTFTPDTEHILGWTPWVLMALGVLCAIPIAIEDWRNRERRFHSRGTAAWAGWGVSLYVLGFLLASQVAQIHGVHG